MDSHASLETNSFALAIMRNGCERLTVQVRLFTILKNMVQRRKQRKPTPDQRSCIDTFTLSALSLCHNITSYTTIKSHIIVGPHFWCNGDVRQLLCPCSILCANLSSRLLEWRTISSKLSDASLTDSVTSWPCCATNDSRSLLVSWVLKLDLQ